MKKEIKQIPLIVTGGFRTVDGMNSALNQGADIIGLGRPFCTEPDFPKKLLSGEAKEILVKECPEKLPKGVPNIIWY